MSTISLPDHPSLGYLKQQARALQQDVRAGTAEAIERVESRYPSGATDREAFPLATAQLVIAREYGFPSWPRLKKFVEISGSYRWEVRTDAPDGESVAARFCRLACLIYTRGDGPDRWAQARDLLTQQPNLVENDIWAAAAAFDAATVERLLVDDPSLARKGGGPYGCSPLFYLSYSRIARDVPRDTLLGIAHRLLEAGADPNEGYLWNGGPYPFTVITGVFGEGEQGPDNQPRQAHAQDLARLLLESGTNANDSQTLYDRMFQPGNEHLELLFEYGLGGDGGTWEERMGETPAEMLRTQLKWAIQHGLLDRVRLLAANGVDVLSPYDDGGTPIELATVNGHAAIADVLAAAGAERPTLDPVAAVIAAAMAGDRTTLEAHPDAVAEARSARPGLLVWAAAQGRIDAVATMLDHGWDVNARGRSDVPEECDFTTALHCAAGDGNVELTKLLLERGADQSLRDNNFDATPLGWAEHFERTETIALLSGGNDADTDH
ncbi:ankyrin repeat domain-containing protein [Tenggerimyces flavus]|uniref:Ankyrin repeat domain-containing protein n=1 Tax=Tenggerimyces flavus TaxID=1708749 RepID=A0ABV7YJJ5_9ACTN|nr:ankyrin repeat domain-containing protein [Tenggerimyces flavus]MBM7784922.1 hypothetical protein [Tenggerimyces flavus]